MFQGALGNGQALTESAARLLATDMSGARCSCGSNYVYTTVNGRIHVCLGVNSIQSRSVHNFNALHPMKAGRVELASRLRRRITD
jgi:hypothetical protein